MVQWSNGWWFSWGAHLYTHFWESQKGRKEGPGWAPGGKGISGRAQELLDAHGLANASLTCGKPSWGVVPRHRYVGESKESN